MDPGRDQKLHPGFRRVPWPPRSRGYEKRLADGGAKNADVQKKFILSLYIAILIFTRLILDRAVHGRPVMRWSNRQEERNSAKSHAVPNELKLGEGR